MRKDRKRLALKIKAIRLLTLLSFFHFSGLNNGFAQGMISVGKVEGINFAPVAISKAVQLASPLNLKRFIFESRWSQIFSHSGKVIGYASQNAVLRMLIEGNLFQIWVNETVKKAGSANIKISARFSTQNMGKSLQSRTIKGHYPESRTMARDQEIYERQIDYVNLWEKFWRWNEQRKLRRNFCPPWVIKSEFYFREIINLTSGNISQLSLQEMFREKFEGIAYYRRGDPFGDANVLVGFESELFRRITHQTTWRVIFFSRKIS